MPITARHTMADLRIKQAARPRRTQNIPEILEDGGVRERRRRRSQALLWLHNPAKRARVIFVLVAVSVVYFLGLQVVLKGKSHGEVNDGATVPQPRAATHMARAARLKARSEQVVIDTRDKHTISNGVLHVNPASTVHPIKQLVAESRAAWNAKLARQSKTLKAAVEEYRRRYHQAPPKGFDKWWRYVKENNVQLPDEYDQIHNDLYLFNGLLPNTIQSRLQKGSTKPDTFTIRVKGGRAAVTSNIRDESPLHADRRVGQLELVLDIAQYLPDMTIVYTIHDTPFSFVSYEHKEDIMLHMEDGEHIDGDERIDGSYSGWKSACPQSAPLHRFDESEPLPEHNPALEAKTFIADHKASMDVCQNPELVKRHGMLAGKKPQVGELSTIFAISKSTLHADVLGVPPERVAQDIAAVPWHDKTASKLFWRGTNTGTYNAAYLPWRDSQRMRLAGLSAEEEGEVVVLPPGKMKGTMKDAARSVQKSSINPAYFDIGFVDGPIQCEHEDGTCREILENYPFKARVEDEEIDSHKYIIDVDGNAWSARFQRLMGSGGLVFKSTITPEWWNDRIQPWVHYIPIKLDYTDLHDALSFFAGDERGVGGDDALAREIGRAGREWSLNFYRKEDMTAYVFRLYLEWARLQAPMRRSMDFEYTGEV